MCKENTIKKIYNIAFKKYPDVLSVKELSSMLNISIKTAYKLLKIGKIKYITIGNILIKYRKFMFWNIWTLIKKRLSYIVEI